MADRTVRRKEVEGKMYRLAYLSYALGYTIQVAEGKGYHTIAMLGWVSEEEAHKFFRHFTGEEEMK